MHVRKNIPFATFFLSDKNTGFVEEEVVAHCSEHYLHNHHIVNAVD